MTAQFSSKQILTALMLNAAFNAKVDASIGAAMQAAITRLENLGAQNYLGLWDASTNTPPLASGVGTNGDTYTVSVAGATELDGVASWGVGDKVTFNGGLGVWQRTPNIANSVSSVAGLTSVVTAADLIAALELTIDDITDATIVGQGLVRAATAAAALSVLGAGSAATKAAGTKKNNVLLLADDDKLPPLDGSALTGINVPVISVAGRTGAVTLAKADVGLANVDNTSDANKPVSTAQQTALNAKLATAGLGAALAALGLGGVGSFAYLALSTTGGSIVAGQTYPGSDLLYAGILGTSNACLLATNGAPPGTWRSMGYCSATTYRCSTLFQRIA
jgi:hypothetical protein